MHLFQTQDRPESKGKMVCGGSAEGHKPPKVILATESVSSKCPRHCTMQNDHHFDETNIEINKTTGILTIKNNKVFFKAEQASVRFSWLSRDKSLLESWGSTFLPD